MTWTDRRRAYRTPALATLLGLALSAAGCGDGAPSAPSASGTPGGGGVASKGDLDNPKEKKAIDIKRDIMSGIPKKDR